MLRLALRSTHGIALAFIPLLVSCGGGGDGGAGPTPDRTAPTVASTTPTTGATGVVSSVTINATFSEPIAAASVTATTFPVRITGGATIGGTYSVSGSTATFTPAAPLALGTSYTAQLTTGVTDVAGNALGAASTWSFTTVPNAAPTANAGANREVNRGETLQLSGSGTDPEGQALTYRWTQVHGGDVTSGAGFLTGANPTITVAPNVGAVRLELRVTDPLGATSAPSVVDIHIMEDKARAIFVAAEGNNASAGTRAAPVRTIARGIALAANAGNGTDVYVSEGVYEESVSLSSGVSVYGGYQTGLWLRDRLIYQTHIRGSSAGTAVSANGVSNVVLDGFDIATPLDGAAAGQSMYGILLNQAHEITIANNAIRAGTGGAGTSGQFGAAGNPAQRGGDGFAATCDATIYGGTAGGGGNAGLPNSGPPIGFRGGDGGQGASHLEGIRGDNGVGASPGTGGSGGAIGELGGSGTAGAAGSAGADGPVGAPLGTLVASGYIATRGADGGIGTPGSSGGGGGGGGGVGGGGGAGGGGAGSYGEPGTGGRSGGGSFAIVAVASTGIVIGQNELRTGAGGNGGAGGSGGTGGMGGGGGVGGAGCANNQGGAGGAGGNGGRGGHGGSGSGGHSIGILEDAASQLTVSPGISYVLEAAGVGGNGPGNPGQSGIRAERLKLP